MRQSINLSFLNVFLLSIATGTFAQKAEIRPNVLILMADDLDFSQLSCFGRQNISTPHIDALEKEGLRFENLYCSEAMCVPTRASLFTCLYTERHGTHQNHKSVYENTEAIGKYHADLGYTVTLSGKNDCTRPSWIYHFILIAGFEKRCIALTPNYTVDSIQAFMTDNEKPFCLFVMSTNTYTPWTVGDPSEFEPDKLILLPHWVDTRTSREMYCKYVAEVKALDNQMCDLVYALKKSGKENNMMIIFLDEQDSAMPGGKWNFYDYGIKSSMIAKLPGIINPGKVTDALVQYEDNTPTLIELEGGNTIDKLSGKSFLSVLRGNTTKHRKYVYGIQNNYPEENGCSIRSIFDLKYKLITNLMPDSAYFLRYVMKTPTNEQVITWKTWLEAAKTDKHVRQMVNKFINYPLYELYDIEKDPFELNKLIDKPELKAEVDMLKFELKNWMRQQNDPDKDLDIALLNLDYKTEFRDRK